MKLKYLNLAAIIIGMASLFSCKGDENYEDAMKLAQENATRYPITRIEIYPNSAQLIADGKSELHFLVKCYQKLNDSITVPVIKDRIPFDKIMITSSDGKTFPVNEGYSNMGGTDSISFTCQLDTVKSKVVKVALTPAEDLNLEPVKVPLAVHAIYSEKTKPAVEFLTKEIMQKIVDRLNKAFAGTLYNAPSSYPANVEFELAVFEKVLVDTETEDTQQKQYDYISQNLIKDPKHYLNIWIVSNMMFDQMPPQKCQPSYTFGNPEDIPFFSANWWDPAKVLTKVSSLSEVPVTPVEVGFPVLYSDCFKMLTGDAANPIETLVGRYYGLLPTGNTDEGVLMFDNTDVDFCPDTFSYLDNSMSHEKQTLQIGENPTRYFYESYNIMDSYSKCTTISRDQVKRLRQVMKDCPYRQMNSLKK